MTDSAALSVDGVSKRFGGLVAVDGMSFHLCLLYTSDAADD